MKIRMVWHGDELTTHFLGNAQKRGKKPSQTVFLHLKKWCFYVRLKYPPGTFLSPKWLGNESSFSERASEENSSWSELSPVVLPGFRENLEFFLLEELNSPQGFDPVSLSSDPSCRERTTHPFPLKIKKNPKNPTQKSVQPLPLGGCRGI